MHAVSPTACGGCLAGIRSRWGAASPCSTRVVPRFTGGRRSGDPRRGVKVVHEFGDFFRGSCDRRCVTAAPGRPSGGGRRRCDAVRFLRRRA
ncbi:hypothetical protein SHJG_5364 [Streptomyces hygroscopicus subsp. jinggangensis 5008]|nr:hypothetical protein SHJG_5364 [Streptomyces hygroscopicus subsp. jinggangensis 5008]AGF64790.1 hypothetical protein SHJGH_5127 [Streptomyces hygroscopicus subsp. jinggangensis TL01]